MRTVQEVEGAVGVLGEVLGVAVGEVEVGDRADQGEHPCLQERHYVLAKLMAFQREHDTNSAECLRDLQAALEQVPQREHRAEAKPLHEELDRIQRGGRHGPQLLGDILPIVLARLGVGDVQSTESGEEDPT